MRYPLIHKTTLVSALVFLSSLSVASAQIPPILKPDPRTPIAKVPYTVTSPGSYYLVDNLNGAPGLAGIVIESSDVTVDLNGFSLLGHEDAQNGIATTAPYQNITITNGTISGWGGDGINLATSTQLSITSVTSSGNSGNGFNLGNKALVVKCAASQNGLNGFAFPDITSMVCARECLATDNYLNGFKGGDPDVAADPNRSGSLSACVATGNNRGFELVGYELRSCSASGNTFDFRTRACTLTSCDSRSSFIGYYVNESTMRFCTVRNTSGVAVYLYEASEMRDCRVAGVPADAQAVLRIFDDCTVRDCDIDAGEFAGSGSMYLEGYRARVQGNTIRGLGHSILISFALQCTVVKNLIEGTIRNDAGAGNNVAPTENAITSTNPWANLQF